MSDLLSREEAERERERKESPIVRQREAHKGLVRRGWAVRLVPDHSAWIATRGGHEVTAGHIENLARICEQVEQERRAMSADLLTRARTLPRPERDGLGFIAAAGKVQVVMDELIAEVDHGRALMRRMLAACDASEMHRDHPRSCAYCAEILDFLEARDA